MMEKLAAANAEPKTVMIDATYPSLAKMVSYKR
jgi:hypothetical protein